MDEFTRECAAIEVDRSLSGLRVTRVLDLLEANGRLPADERRGQRQEFAWRTLDAWAYTHGVTCASFAQGKANRQRVRRRLSNGTFR